MRRAQQRRQAAEQRRATLRRRRAGLAVTAALGATALLAPAAHADTFQVNTLSDDASATDGVCDSTTPDGCTLRDAISQANGSSTADTITFASDLTGTITLTQGQLQVNSNGGDLAIQGPGAGTLSVSGNDASRIFSVNGPNPVSISGLKLTGGATGTTLSANLTNSSTCSSNSGGAVYASTATDVTIASSTLTGNQAAGGGGALASCGSLTVRNSTISGNSAETGGGIQSSGKYAQTQISDSTISGNHADAGGGIAVFQFYKYQSPSSTAVKHAVKSEIANTTISGNTATNSGGGIEVGYLGDGDHFTITQSTISGNDAASSDATGFGGGIHFASGTPGKGGDPGLIDGEFRAIDATISGNTADVGGGLSAGGMAPQVVQSFAATVDQPVSVSADDPVIGPDGSIEFENSTIASNAATGHGGGVYLNSYHSSSDSSSPLTSPTIALTSTIIGDNSAGGAANDADRADGSQGGGLDLSYSLVENPGDAPLTRASSITGVDPQLGGLTDNGGPTQTQLPSATSPVIDQGKAPARLLTDQRGHARTVQGDVSDVGGGDGTDIGAVEVDNPARIIPASQPQPAPADQTPPRITLKVPKSLSIQQLIRGFRVTVSCSEPCSMYFRLFGSSPTGTLHHGTLRPSGYNFRLVNIKIGRKAGRRKVRLRPCVIGAKSAKRTRVCRRRIAASLYAKPQKRFKVKLVVAAKDDAGNNSYKKRFIRIHR